MARPTQRQARRRSVRWALILCAGSALSCADGAPAVGPAPAPPGVLQYTPSAATALLDAPVAMAAGISGDGLTFTVAPELPKGLQLDPQRGTISGTPTATTAGQSYWIAAENESGTAYSQVFIAVSG